jgi:hypothetical protein
MLVLPVGTFVPVTPITPVAPVTPRKAKTVDKSAPGRARTRPARTASTIASYSTQSALDAIKLGG